MLHTIAGSFINVPGIQHVLLYTCTDYYVNIMKMEHTHVVSLIIDNIRSSSRRYAYTKRKIHIHV